jgi:acyl-[acyl-carrier-protein]-phospholipid O-acyltransferase/long-chain-fatty-acid--[acyl-carrier-protein] ligase
VTILMTTPTFLRTYLKRCEPEHFTSVNLVIVGAEKMPLDLAQAFEDKFKVRPIEGYGTTELSPLVSVNVPDHRAPGWMQKGTKEGSVGRPIPNTTAKIVDPDTFAELPVNTPGLLLIKGPNVMKGYLNKPDLTAKAIQDGWYITGDVAKLDDEGFIHITGRQSRFSKIGGEMVPHILVEETLNRILCNGQEDGELRAVITSVPDEKKGERLIVVHKSLPKSVDEVLSAMGTSGLPNLWLPSKDSFLEVEEIPVLGTGKLDLKRLQSVALEKFSGVATSS